MLEPGVNKLIENCPIECVMQMLDFGEQEVNSETPAPSYQAILPEDHTQTDELENNPGNDG